MRNIISYLLLDYFKYDKKYSFTVYRYYTGK